MHNPFPTHTPIKPEHIFIKHVHQIVFLNKGYKEFQTLQPAE